MATDWLPRQDLGFDAAAVAFNDWVQANGAARGLTAPQLSELAAAYADWAAALAAHQAAQTAADAALQAKETQRERLTPLLRRLAGILRESPLVTDGERVGLGLRVRSSTRTRAPVPTTRPIVAVDTSKRLEHTLDFRDASTPQARRRPAGVRGVEIWRFLGAAPPSGPAQCSFVSMATRTPHRVTYSGAEANQVAHYLLRWVNTRGEKGPWSETVSATIGA